MPNFMEVIHFVVYSGSSPNVRGAFHEVHPAVPPEVRYLGLVSDAPEAELHFAVGPAASERGLLWIAITHGRVSLLSPSAPSVTIGDDGIARALFPVHIPQQQRLSVRAMAPEGGKAVQGIVILGSDHVETLTALAAATFGSAETP